MINVQPFTQIILVTISRVIVIPLHVGFAMYQQQPPTDVALEEISITIINIAGDVGDWCGEELVKYGFSNCKLAEKIGCSVGQKVLS